MLLNVILATIAVIAVGTCGVYWSKVKEQRFILADELKRSEKNLKDLGARVKAAEKQAEQVIYAERKRARIVSRIADYNHEDGDFLNRIEEYSKKPDMQFVIEQIHRSIYEAALTAPTDEMILNAIGKGKGVRMIENTLKNPLRLFGMDGSDEQ